MELEDLGKAVSFVERPDKRPHCRGQLGLDRDGRRASTREAEFREPTKRFETNVRLRCG